MYIYCMKTKLLLFSALAFVMLCFNGCTPDTVENTDETLAAQDSIEQVLSQLQGTWYMYNHKKLETWYDCDGYFRMAWTENRTNNLEYANFKFIFSSVGVNLSPANYQFNFYGNPHSGYLKLQVNGNQDYYAVSKEGNGFMLYNDVNNAGSSYSMGGKYSLQFQGDTLMSLYGYSILTNETDLFLFKKNTTNSTPENPIGLNGTYVLVNKEEISSGVTVSSFNYTNGLSVTFTNEIAAPGLGTYSYVPDAYKGVWYKAQINSGGVGPYLEYINCETSGVFYFSTGVVEGINAGQILNVGNKDYEIVTNDGTNLTLRKGGICSHTEWNFVKVM